MLDSDSKDTSDGEPPPPPSALLQGAPSAVIPPAPFPSSHAPAQEVVTHVVQAPSHDAYVAGKLIEAIAQVGNQISAASTHTAEIERASAHDELEREKIRSARIAKANADDGKIRVMRETSNRWFGMVGLAGAFAFLTVALIKGELTAAVSALSALATVLVTLAVAGGQLRKNKREPDKDGDDES